MRARALVGPLPARGSASARPPQLLLQLLRLERSREAVTPVQPVAEVDQLAARGAEGAVGEVVREVVELPLADRALDGHPASEAPRGRRWKVLRPVTPPRADVGRAPPAYDARRVTRSLAGPGSLAAARELAGAGRLPVRALEVDLLQGAGGAVEVARQLFVGALVTIGGRGVGADGRGVTRPGISLAPEGGAGAGRLAVAAIERERATSESDPGPDRRSPDGPVLRPARRAARGRSRRLRLASRSRNRVPEHPFPRADRVRTASIAPRPDGQRPR